MRTARVAQVLGPLILAAIMLSPCTFAARQVITPTTAPGRYPTAGVTVNTTSADTSNLSRFLFTGDGRDLLLVFNNSGTTVTVSVSSVADSSLGGRTGSIVAESVSAWTMKIFGPFAGVGWRQTDGYIYCEASSSNVTLSKITLP